MKIPAHPAPLKAILLYGLLAACLFASEPVFAKEFKLPNDDFAIASIDIPKNWKPETVDNGVEAQSADGAIYISIVAAGTEKGIKEDTDATFEMLKEHKVKIDESTAKTGKGQTNGFPTQSITLKGKDEDGPCTITILFITIKSKVVVFTYWFTDAELDKHAKEVDKIQGSLKAAS